MGSHVLNAHSGRVGHEEAPKYISCNVREHFSPNGLFWKLWLEIRFSGYKWEQRVPRDWPGWIS